MLLTAKIQIYQNISINVFTHCNCTAVSEYKLLYIPLGQIRKQLYSPWGLAIIAVFTNYLIPQNSKRRSESQEGMNPAITSSKSKAELTSVNSEMTGNENKIINYGTDPAAFDSAVANRHIILLH